MMASPSGATNTPRVLILGHSFVRRLETFIKLKLGDGIFALNFDLTQRCFVSMLGIGGRTVDKIIRHDLQTRRNYTPDVVVLELGSNDLCEEDNHEQTVALAMEALVEMLYADLSVQFVMVCAVTARAKPPFAHYNERVSKLNNALAKTFANARFARLWRHRGLCHPSVNIFLLDGIHLNDLGNKALYGSYRGAILLALQQIYELRHQA